MIQKIYLAGPITGCTFGECVDWRHAFTELMPAGVQCLSPMRGKDYLRSESVIVHDYPETILSCQRGIMTRDFYDCQRCDLVVANFLGASSVSVGTVMEVAWAFGRRTPVIAVMEEFGNPHDHPMMREAFGFRVTSLELAADTAKLILHPVDLNPLAAR